jgi:hypothetical protein
MCVNKYIALGIVLSAAVLTMSCCPHAESGGQKPVSREAVLKYMESRFVKGYGTNRLFCDESSSDRFLWTEVLLDYLGYSDFEWNRFTVSSDQRYLRFWQDKNDYLHRAITRVLVLGRDAEPRIYEFPEAASWMILDNDNKPIVWRDESNRRDKFIFANGGIVHFPAQHVVFDDAGEYFCSGGHYYDTESDTRKNMPLDIYSGQDPSKPLVRSHLYRAPDSIFTTEQKVYLVMRNVQTSDNTPMPYGIACEIYNRENKGLTLAKEFAVDCPRHFGARWLYPIDFDEDSNLMLLYLDKAKFFSPEWYLLNMESLELVKIKDHACNQLRLIDPNALYDIIAIKTK